MGHLKVIIGHLRVTVGHPRVTNYRLFVSISKHKANTTELHPKVRQTCYFIYYWTILPTYFPFGDLEGIM